MAKTQLFRGILLVIAATAGTTVAAWMFAEAKIQKLNDELTAARTDAKAASERERIADSRRKELEAEIDALRKTASRGSPMPEAAAVPVPTSRPPASHDAAAKRSDDDFRVQARISAIEKFVPLNDEQRAKLKEKYKQDLTAGSSSSASGKDELADIIGQENADYYRGEMRRAFEKAEAEEREKDIYYLSRKLNLSADQERAAEQAMIDVEANVAAALKQQAAAGSSMQDRVQSMVAENKLRQDLLNEQLQKIFSAEQYRLYLEQHLDSAEGNIPVWHGGE